MADVTFGPVQPGDVQELAASMRQADRLECEAAFGDVNPETMLQRSVDASWVLWVCRIDGRLAAILGAAPLSIASGTGIPWLIGTPVMDQHPRAVMESSARYIPKMLATFPHLVNHIDVRSTRSIRWLKRLGFTFSDTHPVGPKRMPFMRFELRA